MANLILTGKCQRKCEYCFAQENEDIGEFSIDSIMEVSKFISTEYKGLNLIGGEPTKHSKFIDVMNYLLTKEFMIQVFTNGMISESLIRQIRYSIETLAIYEEQILFAVNVNEDKYSTKNEKVLQTNTFEVLNKYTYLSYTIQDVDSNILFLGDMINRYNLNRNIRLGLALPIFGGNNKHLNLNDYKLVAKSVIRLIEEFEDIIVTLDCGFPLCMFSMEDLHIINSKKNARFSFGCGQPVDIYPNLDVINCYPLKNVYKSNLLNYKNIKELRLDLESSLMTAHGIYGNKCTECVFFRKVCQGGCKGFYKPIEGGAIN